MPSLPEMHLSIVALIAGGTAVLLGFFLAVVSRGRGLNDLGKVLCGFLFGAGLALGVGGLLFNLEISKEFWIWVLSGFSAQVPERDSAAAPVLINVGEQLAFITYRIGALFRQRLTYFIPCAAILVVFLYGLFSTRVVRRLFGAGLQQGMQGFLTAMLIPLALLAAGNYTNFANWRYGTYFNSYEFYHYYIGTKYAPEVGYENMYNASLIADDETGGRYKNNKNTLRDLSTGAHVPLETVYKKRDEIKAHFSEARWQEFLKDIRFFKGELGAGRWSSILGDKGYNGTPYWTMWVGGLFSERVDTTNRAGLMCLALLDPLLMILALLCVWRAFGPRAALLMIILVGTSYVMSYTHMKGAFLRMDFAMSLVMAVCMIKLGHYRTAGALMMYAALSRVFPAVFFFGAGVKLLQNVVLYWRPRLGQVTSAFVACIVLTFVLSAAAPIALFLFKGGHTWQEAMYALLPFVPKPEELVLVKVLAAEFIGCTLLSAVVCGLWLLGTSPQCRPYARLFSSATVVLIVFSVAVLLDPRTGKVYVEDFADKIGRHLSDLSPWRVGYKYLFINLPAIQNERLADDAKVAAAEAAPAEAAPGTTESPDDHAEAPDVAETPVPAPVKAAAPQLPADEKGMARVFLSTERDMRFAAEKAWKKAFVGKDPAAAGPDFSCESVLAAPFKDWGAFKGFVFDFFKTYVPAIRGRLYTEYDWHWKLTMLIVLAVSFFAVLGLKDHEALAWSFVPVFFLVAPTYYYYIMLTIPLLFFTSALERPSRAFGVILMLATAMPGYYFYSQLAYGQQFATYYWHSVMFFFLTLYMLILAYGDGVAAVFRSLRRRVG